MNLVYPSGDDKTGIELQASVSSGQDNLWFNWWGGGWGRKTKKDSSFHDSVNTEDHMQECIP